jgi:hypothetical protein
MKRPAAFTEIPILHDIVSARGTFLDVDSLPKIECVPALTASIMARNEVAYVLLDRFCRINLVVERNVLCGHHIPSAFFMGVGILGRLARPSFNTSFMACLTLESSCFIRGFLERSRLIVPNG